MVCIVGFAGPATVGKTTTVNKIYDILSTTTNKKIIVYSFARKLYETCSLLTNISCDLLEQQGYKDTPWNELNAPLPFLIGWTPRKFLQQVGTECFRNNIHENFWVEEAALAVKDYDIALMYDARFENEYKRCDIMFELHRNGIEYACNHASAMPPPQYLIHHHLYLHPQIDLSEACDIILTCRKEG